MKYKNLDTARKCFVYTCEDKKSLEKVRGFCQVNSLEFRTIRRNCKSFVITYNPIKKPLVTKWQDVKEKESKEFWIK